MHEKYNQKYPYLWGINRYKGKYQVDDQVPGMNMTVSRAILSPTRQFVILVKMIIEEAKKRKAFHLIHGMCQNTGGGLTKIKHLGRRIHYMKYINNWAPFFLFIKKATRESYYNMQKTFNCGFGLDIVGSPYQNILSDVMASVSERSGVKYWQVGGCADARREKNKITIHDWRGKDYKY
jgi:phosphoribosylformylglycinamidine cyclo-ligase